MIVKCINTYIWYHGNLEEEFLQRIIQMSTNMKNKLLQTLSWFLYLPKLYLYLQLIFIWLHSFPRLAYVFVCSLKIFSLKIQLFHPSSIPALRHRATKHQRVLEAPLGILKLLSVILIHEFTACKRVSEVAGIIIRWSAFPLTRQKYHPHYNWQQPSQLLRNWCWVQLSSQMDSYCWNNLLQQCLRSLPTTRHISHSCCHYPGSSQCLGWAGSWADLMVPHSCASCAWARAAVVLPGLDLTWVPLTESGHAAVQSWRSSRNFFSDRISSIIPRTLLSAAKSRPFVT